MYGPVGASTDKAVIEVGAIKGVPPYYPFNKKVSTEVAPDCEPVTSDKPSDDPPVKDIADHGCPIRVHTYVIPPVRTDDRPLLVPIPLSRVRFEPAECRDARTVGCTAKY